MGYILIDNTASGGKRIEKDTTYCRHCQAVIDIKRWRKEGGIWKCSKCDGPVCWTCAGIKENGNLICDPWQAKINRDLDNAWKEQQQIKGII